jgi:oligopeptide transport system ATP-binding protein
LEINANVAESAAGTARLARPFLQVSNLSLYVGREDTQTRLICGVEFSLEKGRTLALVGESGSGKTLTARSVIGLLPRAITRIEGEIWFDGIQIARASKATMQSIRGSRISMVAQDPAAALNPCMTIGNQMTEPLCLHLKMKRSQAREFAENLLKSVGIPDVKEQMNRYPHQLSGGMKQRVAIAMALTCSPDMLIADEPTTALDVTVQAQILKLLRELIDESGMTVIFVSHNLGVVAGIADDVVVIYGGKVVERGPVEDIFANPRHPYTKALLSSIPRVNLNRSDPLTGMPGAPPEINCANDICPFFERCSERDDSVCSHKAPPFLEIADNHHAACFFATAFDEQEG